MLLFCFVVVIVHAWIFCLCFSQKQSANQAKKIQGNVVLLNWKAHAKIQALLKEKKFHLKKSLTSLLHQAIQLLDEVFVISGIIKVEVSVISLSLRLQLITLTETLIISDITKTESNNCFNINRFKANNGDKRIIARKTVYFRHAMFLLCCTWTWHCSWKSGIVRTTYRSFTNL